MAQRGIVKNGLSADIAAEHHAALFSTMYGKSGICSGFNELACTKVDNNTVRLASGVYSLSGYALMVDPGTTEDLTIDSGTFGQNRNDLIVAEFVRNGGGLGVDTLHFTVVKGTSTSGTAADPELVQQDINAAGVTRQETLYRVKVVGTEITAVEKVAGSVSNLNLVESAMPVDSASVTDFNEITKSGFYRCFANTLNAPESGSNSLFTVIHARPDTTRRLQIAVKISGEFYWRSWYGSSWTDWIKLPIIEINGLISGSVLPSGNLDDLYGTSGTYQLITANTYTNSAGVTAGVLVVEAAPVSTIQRLVNPSINKIRYRGSTGWSEWRDA